VTLPNYITFSRIVAVPLFIVAGSERPVFPALRAKKRLWRPWCFIAASITDGLDGYLARRRGQVTTLGMLLDPLADKLLITAALVTLVQFNPAMVPAWIAVLVIGREFLVSGLRGIASSKASPSKPATSANTRCSSRLCRSFAVILDHRWHAWHLGPVTVPVHWIAQIAVWGMIALSLWSAIDYFTAFWSKIDRQAVKRRRRAFVSQPPQRGRRTEQAAQLIRRADKSMSAHPTDPYAIWVAGFKVVRTHAFPNRYRPRLCDDFGTYQSDRRPASTRALNLALTAFKLAPSVLRRQSPGL